MAGQALAFEDGSAAVGIAGTVQRGLVAGRLPRRGGPASPRRAGHRRGCGSTDRDRSSKRARRVGGISPGATIRPRSLRAGNRSMRDGPGACATTWAAGRRRMPFPRLQEYDRRPRAGRSRRGLSRRRPGLQLAGRDEQTGQDRLRLIEATVTHQHGCPRALGRRSRRIAGHGRRGGEQAVEPGAAAGDSSVLRSDNRRPARASPSPRPRATSRAAASGPPAATAARHRAGLRRGPPVARGTDTRPGAQQSATRPRSRRTRGPARAARTSRRGSAAAELSTAVRTQGSAASRRAIAARPRSVVAAESRRA